MSSKSRAAELGALWQGSGSPPSGGGTADSDQLLCLDQRIPLPGPVPRGFCSVRSIGTGCGSRVRKREDSDSGVCPPQLNTASEPGPRRTGQQLLRGYLRNTNAVKKPFDP